MGHVSGSSAKKRVGRLAVAGALVAMLGAALLPASGASAGRPLPPTPHKPVVVDVDGEGDVTEIAGTADMNNGCGGPLCRTYLAIMYKKASTYEIYSWIDISNLPGPQTIYTVPQQGDTKYRTAVLDYVSYFTGATCGPTSMRIAGVRYARFNCGSGMTTYFKIFASAPVSIEGSDDE